MAKKVYDLAVKTGEYEKDGETKSRYENIGIVMEGDNGMFLMLKRTFNPAGVPDFRGGDDWMMGDTILISMFEPQEGDSKPANKGGSTRGRRGSK